MKCKYCKKVIQDGKQFCSGSCAGAYTSINKKGEKKTVVCKKCSKSFEVSIRGPSAVLCINCKMLQKQVAGICEYCNKEFKTTNKSKKFCNMSCGAKNLFKLGKFTGGLTRLGGQKHYKKGYYDNNYFDSGWELAYWLYCKDNNISIQRNLQGFEYIFDGKKRKYYPDFIVDGEYVEIKGYVKDRDKAKFKAVKVKVVTKSEMKEILEQVINKHGREYVSNLVNDNR